MKVSFMPWTLCPSGKSIHINLTEGWVGPRPSLDTVAKRKISDPAGIEPRSSSTQANHYTD